MQLIKTKIDKNQWIGILIVALSFGTAWAVRGQFGHEQGAAWAAAIGGLALVVASGRKDWFLHVLPVTLASAVGWGMGGMISYGLVVGYGRSDSLMNAGYGLLMLFVIGGLYGLIGGGLTGLTLESTKTKKVNWGLLIAEMVAGGLIVYGFLVMQLEIFMTPPRSEAWAFCLGAGLALVWYMARNSFDLSLRLALYAMIGAGFGFAFGNFLQIMGNILEIKFNMWNVMEYSIGFFGGTGLAYGTYTVSWPEKTESPKPWENRVSWFIVIVIIPLIVFKESLTYSSISERLKSLPGSEGIVWLSSVVAILLIGAVALFYFVKMEKLKFKLERKTIWMFFLLLFAAYVAESFIVTGLFFGNILSNHLLYLANIIVVVILLRTDRDPIIGNQEPVLTLSLLVLFSVAILIIILLTVLLINVHGELNSFHNRFPVS